MTKLAHALAMIATLGICTAWGADTCTKVLTADAGLTRIPTFAPLVEAYERVSKAASINPTLFVCIGAPNAQAMEVRRGDGIVIVFSGLLDLLAGDVDAIG